MIKFTLPDLFEIAINMEKAGEIFYLQASEKCRTIEVRRTLRSLGEMEIEHGKLFSSMRKDIPEHHKNLIFEIKDPEEYLYFQNLLQNKGVPMPRIDYLLSANALEKDFLEYALDREKDAVVFYSTMKEYVNLPEASNNIQRIVLEEVKHVKILTSLLLNPA